MSAGKFLMPYCLASRLSLILTKSTPNESVSSSIFSSSANTLSHVKQLRASVGRQSKAHKISRLDDWKEEKEEEGKKINKTIRYY